MPRTFITAERTRLAGDYNVYTRVEVQNSAGTWIDLTAYTGGRNYFVQAKWSRLQDAPIMAGTLTFLREAIGISLAPTMVGSALNTVAAAYSPLLRGGAGVRISTACTALATAPVSGDWKEMFLGRIDDPDWGGDEGTIQVTISDVGAWLLGKNIDTERQYAASTGTALETVMQSILTDNASGPLTAILGGAVTLYTPVSPAWNIKTYTQQKVGVLEALRALAAQIGWDVRFMYDAAGVYRLTLYQPARTKTVSDLTIAVRDYYELPQLAQNLGDVRTRIGGSYIDATTHVRTWRYVQADATHTNQYDVVYMEVNEDATSNIDSATEMDKMLNAILSDLQDPAATQRVIAPYFWLVELGDLCTFTQNGVHYNQDQQLAVVGIEHQLDASGEVTTLTCRGKVSGSYKLWLDKQSANGGVSDVPAPPIPSIVYASQTIAQATLTLSAIDNAHSSALAWRYRLTVGGAPGAWSAISTVALPQTLVVTRDVFYSTLVELEVTQGDGQVAVERLAVHPKLPALDPTVGKIDRTAQYNDGYYAIRGSDTLGIHAESAVTDSRSALINTMGRYNVDTLDGWGDSSSYKKSTPLQVQRTIGTSGALRINEPFDVLPGTPASAWTASGGTPAIVANGGNIMGQNIVRATSYTAYVYRELMPFNPLKLYRIRFRARTSSANMAGTSNWYVGFIQTDATGASTNNNGGNGYCVSPGTVLTVGVWTEFVTWVKGASVAFTLGTGASSDPRSPAALNLNTTQIQPIIYAGYNGTGGVFEFDYFTVEEFDEDASLRLYSTVQSDNASLYATVKDTRASLVNTLFRYGTDGPVGVVESSVQAFVHPSYTDTSRRPIQTYTPDTRSVNAGPSSYGVGSITEFKDANVIGIPGASASTYGNLRTEKPWTDSSGGNATQTFSYTGDNRVWKRTAPAGSTTWTGSWRVVTESTTQRFDRDSGHLDATMQDTRSSLVNNAFRISGDTLASVLDGAGFNRVSSSYADSSNRLVQLYDAVGATGLTGTQAIDDYRRSTNAIASSYDGTFLSTAKDARPSLINTHGRISSDSLDSWLDTTNYKKATPRQVARASASSGNVRVNEVFDVVPGSAESLWAVSAGAASVVANAGANIGTNIARCGFGYTQLDARESYPFSPDKLYRLRCRVRTSVANTSGLSQWYIGFYAKDAAGVPTNANSGASYVAAGGSTLILGAWTEFIGWFKGATVPYASGAAGFSSDPNAPVPLNVNTTQIQPLIYAGYAGTGGTFEVDYFIIDEFDEDASGRTYGGFDSGSNLRGNVLANNGSAARNILSGSRARLTGFMNAGSYSFIGTVAGTPIIVITGGVTYEPGAVWGNATQADGNAGAGAAAPANARQVDEMLAYNVSSSGFTVRARLKQSGGAITGRSNAPASSSAITTIGGNTTYVSANAPSYDDNYAVSFSYSFTKAGGPNSSSISAVVSLDYYNGTSYVSTVTGTYSASDAGTSSGGSGTSTASGSDTLIATVTGRTTTSSWRIILQSVTTFGVGARTLSLTPGNLTYSTSAADTYATKTPTGTGITCTADISGAE